MLYVGFYFECLPHWLGSSDPPTLVVAFFFWVVVVAGSMIVGSLASAWNERPWHTRQWTSPDWRRRRSATGLPISAARLRPT